MRFDHALLRRVRLELGLTQTEAAAAVGIDVRTWRRYESGAVNGARGFEVRRAGRRALLSRLSAELGVAEADWLVDDPAPDPQPAAEPVSGPCRPVDGVHPLPRARHFTGRGALLDRLRAWLADPDPVDRVVALVGPGGAGKTSIAERLLGAGPAWCWSFYEDDRPDAMLRALCAAMNLPADPLGAAPARISGALTALGPCALVFDGLEVAQSPGDGHRARGEVTDPPLRRLLRFLAGGAGGCRALVTSRLPLVDLDGWAGAGYAAIDLDGLDPSDGAELLRRWGVRGAADDLADLTRQAGGHALTLAMTAAWIEAFGDGEARAGLDIPDPAPLVDLDPRARRLDAVLRACADGLPPVDRALLVRLSLLDHGVDAGTLAAVAADPAAAGALAGLAEDAIEQRLHRLAHQGWVHRLGRAGRWGAHPLLRARFRRLSVVPDGAVETAVARHLARAVLDPTGRPGPDGAAAVLDRAEALFAAMLRAGRVDAALGVYRRTLGGWTHLGLRLEQTSRLLRLLAGFSTDGTPAGLSPALDPSARLDLAYQWSLAATSAGDLPLARRALAVARAQAALPPTEAVVWRAVAYVEWMAGETAAATRAAAAARRAAQRVRQRSAMARAEALSGAIAHAAGHDAAAATHFDAARTLDGEGLVARRGVWAADWRTARGEPDRAVADLERNVAVCDRRGWPAHAALARLALVDACVAAGRLEHGRQVMDAVRPAVARTGEFEVRLRALAAELDLARADGDRATAEAHRIQGEALARSGGFALLGRRFSTAP